MSQDHLRPFNKIRNAKKKHMKCRDLEERKYTGIQSCDTYVMFAYVWLLLRRGVVGSRFSVDAIPRLPQTEVIFLNCGHLCVCRSCSGPLDTCPMCRQTVLQKLVLTSVL